MYIVCTYDVTEHITLLRIHPQGNNNRVITGFQLVCELCMHLSVMIQC